MLTIEKLKENHLIQIQVDTFISLFKNCIEEQKVLDFINLCKANQFNHIFIGKKNSPTFNINIKQYQDFVENAKVKILGFLKEHLISSIPKKVEFVLLLKNDNFITSSTYQSNLDKFKLRISNQNFINQLHRYLDFQPIIFGNQFEHILIDVLDNKSSYIITEENFPYMLSKYNQELISDSYQDMIGLSANNPIIRYFNSYFKSKKNSDCVNLSDCSKTDIYYRNRNGSLNEISIKTKCVKSNQKLTRQRIKLSTSFVEFDKWKKSLYNDPIKTIKMFFNKTYNTKHDQSPYPSHKNDNVKFLLLYYYNLDNPNHNVSGQIYILNMKRMFNLLLHYMNHDKVRCFENWDSLDININGEQVFQIKIQEYKGKIFNVIYSFFDIENSNSFFSQLIDFKIPLHLDSKCLDIITS